jgi:hypothetical protein
LFNDTANLQTLTMFRSPEFMNLPPPVNKVRTAAKSYLLLSHNPGA